MIIRGAWSGRRANLETRSFWKCNQLCRGMVVLVVIGANSQKANSKETATPNPQSVSTLHILRLLCLSCLLGPFRLGEGWCWSSLKHVNRCTITEACPCRRCSGGEQGEKGGGGPILKASRGGCNQLSQMIFRRQNTWPGEVLLTVVLVTY